MVGVERAEVGRGAASSRRRDDLKACVENFMMMRRKRCGCSGYPVSQHQRQRRRLHSGLGLRPSFNPELSRTRISGRKVGFRGSNALPVGQHRPFCSRDSLLVSVLSWEPGVVSTPCPMSQRNSGQISAKEVVSVCEIHVLQKIRVSEHGGISFAPWNTVSSSHDHRSWECEK